MLMNFLYFSDVHQSDRAPSGRKDDYTETIFAKLKEIGELAGEHNCALALFGGDMFHFKSPVKNSHSLVRRMIETFKAFPCPVAGVVGNHDLSYANPDMIGIQPIAVMEAAGAINLLDVWSGDAARLKAPKGYSIRVEGIPYRVDFDLDSVKIDPRQDKEVIISMVHALTEPKAGDLGGEKIFAFKDFSGLGVQVLLPGHYHKNQGVHQVGDMVVAHPGAVVRGTLHYEDLSRKPTVAIVHVDESGCHAEEVELVTAPAVKDCFRIEAKNAKDNLNNERDNFVEIIRQDPKQIEGFVEKLKSDTSPATKVDVGRIVDRMKSIDVEVKNRIKKYLELATK